MDENWELLASGSSSKPEESSQSGREFGFIKRTEESIWRTELRGFIYIIIASVCSAASAACSTALNGEVPIAEMNIFRFLALMLMCLPFFVHHRKIQAYEKLTTPWDITLWTLLFALLNSIFITLLYFSLPFISIGLNNFVVQLGSILILACVSWTYFRTRILCCDVAAVITASIGITMAYNKDIWNSSTGQEPWNNTIYTNCTFRNSSDIQQNTTSNCDNEGVMQTNKHRSLVIGVVLSILCALVGSGCYILQRARLSEVGGIILSFWCGIIGAIFSFTIAIIFEHMLLPSTWPHWLLLLSYCVFSSFFAIFGFIAQAIASTDSIIRIALAYCSQIIFYFIFQCIFLETIHLGTDFTVQICGMVLVLIALNLPAIDLYISFYNRDDPIQAYALT